MNPPLDQLSCTEVGPRLEAYLDGELDPAERRSIHAHLESCAECAEELRLAEEISVGLRSLTRLEPPLGVLDRVHNAAGGLQAPPGRRRLVPFANPRRAWAGLAAAATVVMALGTVAWQERTRPTLSDQEIRRATTEARVALAYVGLASRRTAEGLRTELLRERVVKPTLHGLSLASQQAEGTAAGTSQGPTSPTTTPSRTRS